MAEPLRVALIGYGFAGRVFHAPLLTHVPGLALTVVASRQWQLVKDALPGVTIVADPLAAITADVDLVVIASPNGTHVPLAMAALRAGRHVVVDKPFTITLAEAREVAALAEQHGRLLSVFQNRRWDSECLAAAAVLASGHLGDVVTAEAHFDRFRPEVRDRWREGPQAGGGLWYDLGPHLVDQMLHLFGLPQAVSGRLAIQRPGGQATDWAHVGLDYGRRQVIVHASMLNAAGSPRFQFHGTLGSWIKAAGDPQEAQLLAGIQPGSPGWGEDPERGILVDGQTGMRESLPRALGDYRTYYAGIRDAIKGLAPIPVTPAQAVAVMAVIETAIRSDEVGQVLPLPLTEAERSAWRHDRTAV
jgi:predicted dehydrogenase